MDDNYLSDLFSKPREKFAGGVVELLKRAVLLYGKSIFLIDEKRSYSFVETDNISTRLSCGFNRIGLKKKDKVIVCLKGGTEFVFSSLAVQKIGAVLVPLNSDLSIHKLQEILGDIKADWVITSGELLPDLQKAGLSGRIIVSGEIPKGFRAESYDQLLKEGGKEPHLNNVNINDDAVICFTSGTTSSSKGVVYRHRNILSSARWIAEINLMKHGDVLLTAIPIYISSNFNGHFLASLMMGVTIVLLKEFDTEDVLKKLNERNVTIFHATGNMHVSLLENKNYSSDNLPDLRILTWSNILPEVLLPKMDRAFPGVKIMQFYGFAEGGPVGTFITMQDLYTHPGSCGKIDPEYASFRIVNESGKDQSSGEIGEIIYQSSGLMREYYRNPEATTKAIRNGWYYTGDLGKIDKDGFLYIVCRNKDIITCLGKKIYPTEVEEVLFKHPSVQDAAVVCIPDSKSGQELKAFIVLKENCHVKTDELISHCKIFNLQPFKIPGHIEFKNALPKNSMGKTLKSELI